MKSTLNICLITWLVLVPSMNLIAQNTLPSCVLTTPHCNAYFKQGSDVMIRVYASDLGGSFSGGSVTNVEFFQDDIKLGEATNPTANTYSFLWTDVPLGTYRITAKATDNENAVSTSAGVIISVGSSDVEVIGLSANKGKYLANIIPGGVRPDFNTYWNGVTSENACKWGSVERTRDVMNWTDADKAYKHALNNHLMFRYHVMSWGSQYPSWITSLSPEEFQAEMEELMAAVADRYPLIDQIDVLNENMVLNTWDKNEHAAGTPYFRTGLGGPGATGYDWVIWLFEKARLYFPNAKLVMNDFELVSNAAGVNEMLDVVKVLRDRGLIDGFGAQAHYFNVDGLSATALNNALNSMAKSGLPIYITELDLKGKSSTEASQMSNYSNLFPVFWNHPAVAGITLWGYVEGATWSSGTGILNSDGSERSAMSWLKTYMSNLPDVGYPFGVGSESLTNILIEAEDFDSQSGLDVILCSEGGNAVSGVNPNDYTEYANVDLSTGYVTFDARVAATYSDGRPQGSIEVRSGSVDGPLLGTLEVLGTGGLEIWQTQSCTLTGAKGVQSIFLVYKKGGYTINWIKFKDLVTSVQSPEVVSDWSIYPNPASSGRVTIKRSVEEGMFSIELMDMKGKIIQTISPLHPADELDVSFLKAGVYSVRIRGEKTTRSQQLIIL